MQGVEPMFMCASRVRLFYFLIFPQLFLSLMWGCLCVQADETVKPNSSIPSVLVQRVRVQSLTPTAEFIGRIEALEKVELRARIKGFLGPRLFQDGDNVQKGQVLFTIEREPFEAAVAQKKAQLAAAQATLEFTKQQLTRANELMQQNSAAITQAKIDERVSEQARANAGVMEAQAALTDAEINLSYTEIKSPINGRISRPAVSPGNLVTPETGVLAVIVAEDPVQIVFTVSQRELLEYRKRGGTAEKIQAQLRLADGAIYEEVGLVDFLDVQVNPRTDGQIVRAMISNSKRILTDGQTVRVVISEESTSKAITIPKAAIALDQSGAYVFIVSDKSRVEQRRVKFGQEQGGQVVIEDGLKESDVVIVQGLQKIRSGITVATEFLSSPPTEEIGKTP